MLNMPVKAQQTNIYQVCRTYQENYSPGYYDRNGNYIPGNVNTNSYNTPCNNQTYYRPNNGGEYYPPPVTQPRQVYCDTTRSVLGAAIGGGLGAIFTNPDTRRYTIPIGAGLGGLAIGCR